MTKFRLNTNEINYIKNAVFIKEYLKHDLLNSTNKAGDHFEIQISDNQIEDLEAIFSERLQKAGFDRDYQTTEEGKLLENLIDKLSDLQ